DRDPLLGRDRLGQPGLPAGHAPDAGRAPPPPLASGASRSGQRPAALLDGTARPADQRNRDGLGLVRRAEHLLAADRDLRAGSPGPVRGPALDDRPGGGGRPVLRPHPALPGVGDAPRASARLGVTGPAEDLSPARASGTRSPVAG